LLAFQRKKGATAFSICQPKSVSGRIGCYVEKNDRWICPLASKSRRGWVAALRLHRAAARRNQLAAATFNAVATENGFSVEVIVYGSPATEYAARGRRYIEALENAEYELRIHNPSSTRVAVALSVDGLNSIDARHTSAWDAHKWVIEPYGTISVRGWQMSSENARRFYFTTERDSYAAKLGQSSEPGSHFRSLLSGARPAGDRDSGPAEACVWQRDDTQHQ
jgi:hypothetical protein